MAHYPELGEHVLGLLAEMVKTRGLGQGLHGSPRFSPRTRTGRDRGQGNVRTCLHPGAASSLPASRGAAPNSATERYVLPSPATRAIWDDRLLPTTPPPTRDASREPIPLRGPGVGPVAPVRSTTSGWRSTSAAGDHARQPGRESHHLRPNRPGGRGSETTALAELREPPAAPRPSFRMRAMTQPTGPLPRPCQGTWSQGPHACRRTSARHRQAPMKLLARIGPPASLLETVCDAIAHCGPVFGRCFPRDNPRRPSLEFQGPDCAKGRRVVHSRRIEAGQQVGGEVGTVLLPQCQCIPQDRFGLGGHYPIVRAAGAKARASSLSGGVGPIMSVRSPEPVPMTGAGFTTRSPWPASHA